MPSQVESARQVPEAHKVFDDRRLVVALESAGKLGNQGTRGGDGGFDPNFKGVNGITPLAWAVARRSSSAITFLLEKGAISTLPIWEGSDMTALHLASSLEDSRGLITSLVRGGVDVDLLDTRGFRTPLVTSIMRGRIDSLRTLLELGADPNLLNRVDEGPLHVAGGVADGEAVIALLAGGANPDHISKMGVTFRSLFFMTPDRVLSHDARDSRRAVSAWLTDHGYRVEEA